MIFELIDLYGPRTLLEYHFLPSLIMALSYNASSGTSLVLHGLCTALPASPVQAFHSPSSKTIIYQPTGSLTLPILVRFLQLSLVVLLFLGIKQACITFYVKAPVGHPQPARPQASSANASAKGKGSYCWTFHTSRAMAHRPFERLSR